MAVPTGAPPRDWEAWLTAFEASQGLTTSYRQIAEQVGLRLAARILAERRRRSGGLVVGLCGPQGSGKSTLAAVLAHLLSARGLAVAVISLDDLYLTQAERQSLGEQVHPLLRTRGPPGTHDVALGEALIDALRRPGRTLIPRFDKAADDRRPPSQWDVFEGPADVVLLEGWCVGARAQPAADLETPINAMERRDDPDGVWRRHVNAALAGPYRALFDRLDLLVLLRAPGFETVLDWRTEQEHKLRAQLQSQGRDPGLAMSDPAIAEFIQRYERLTRHILAEMPSRADIVVDLDRRRRLVAWSERNADPSGATN